MIRDDLVFMVINVMCLLERKLKYKNKIKKHTHEQQPCKVQQQTAVLTNIGIIKLLPQSNDFSTVLSSIIQVLFQANKRSMLNNKISSNSYDEQEYNVDILLFNVCSSF